MWSLDYLADRRRIAPVAFSFQYQNQIIQTSELSLSPDLIVKGNISTDFESLGKRAIRTIENMVSEKKEIIGQVSMIPVNIVIRKSTKV